MPKARSFAWVASIADMRCLLYETEDDADVRPHWLAALRTRLLLPIEEQRLYWKTGLP